MVQYGGGASRSLEVPSLRVGLVMPVWLTTPGLVEMTLRHLSLLKPDWSWVRERGACFSVHVICTRLHGVGEAELLAKAGAAASGLAPFAVQVTNDGERSVAGAWNYGCGLARGVGCELLWLLANDAEPRPGLVERLVDFGLNNPGVDLWSGCDERLASADPGAATDGCDFTCAMLRPATLERFGEFDARFRPCLAPDTPVLTDDLRWVPVGELRVGDGIVGVDEYPAPGLSRSYRQAFVSGVRSLRADRIRIHFEDGRNVVCTPNHRWLAKTPKASGLKWKWREAGSLSVDYRVYSPLYPWEELTDFDSGWLSGIFDGEGCIHFGDRMRGVSFSQNEGVVLNKALKILTERGVPFNTYRRPDSVTTVEINRRSHFIRVIGQFRPVRLLHSRVWEGLRLRSKRHEAHDSELVISSIEPAGCCDVVDLQTTTATFIANGMVSHNSYFEDNDYAARVWLGGGEMRVVHAAQFFHHGSQTVKQCPDAAHHVNHWFPVNRRRFAEKWGTDRPAVSKEDALARYFPTPFNVTGRPLSWADG